ncbi:MAG: tRNA (adenosine(37)-N6)-threonylcarbamoyltransferase complex transferase subunit TsaD [Bacilli bacterium]|nr:tRNA (adenosine(37)-N6)-threonylcarbamoyltransferase complex transferase subunit TsaD [Bacilli bacterium]
MKDVIILAIETSCDETSMAIVKNGNSVLAMTVLTQMDTHANFGGVVPEIASRMHTENITMVLEDTLKKAQMTVQDVDAIAVTYAPGLLGSLLVGVECAKVLSMVYHKPLIAVNHTMGHIFANAIDSHMVYPCLALIVSGGHTDLVQMNSADDILFLGSTIDDAVGEVYDKVARVLGLKYPGGPNVDRLSKEGEATYSLPKPMTKSTYDFSFSGLKSAVINLVHNEEQRGNEIRKADLARSFQDAAVDELKRKVEFAYQQTNIKEMILAGGVSANQFLRSAIEELSHQYGVHFHVPDYQYCTDNAAMIGAAAYILYQKGKFADFHLDAQSNVDIKAYVEQMKKHD